MCGIAGVAGESDPYESAQRVRTMMAALARRGPDGEGLHAWPSAVLGHRRLAIFDLSQAGKQPMLSPDGSVGVTFNGAIYNFVELREELERAGYGFTSRTDTEVLVHGYREWGIERLVGRLQGMFAFALWDDRDRALYLVRDRLGVKPLLYVQPAGSIAFASTASALNAGGYAPELDEQAVVEFLEYGFVTEQRSIYAGVKKVPPAHIACWRGTDVTLTRYWQAPGPARDSMRFDEAVDETERLLLRAVERRLAADVRVGALLSGGIDSSLVCWAISRLGGDVSAFTVGVPGDAWDESSDARETARELGIPHRVLEQRPENSPDVLDLVAAYGEPFACASALGMIGVSQAVRSEATVLLTGDGGDDSFLGYPRHAHLYLAQRIAGATPRPVAAAWKSLRSGVPKIGPMRRAAHLADYATGGLSAVADAHDGLPAYARMGMLGERLHAAGVDARMLPWSIDSGRRVLTDFIDYERRTRFTGEYLTKVDGGTMYHALEARSPFLDQDLWSFACALPYDLRLHGGRLKAILRELARRRIGERVASGSKRGFGIPVHRWIAGRWRAAALSAFEDSILSREGWIDGEAVRVKLCGLREGDNAPQQLWYLFVLESWLKSRHARVAQAVAS